jgi:phage FluMu gp28-like protein
VPKADEPVGDLYLSLDVGATQDLSVPMVTELRGEHAYIRRLDVWQGVPLEEQQQRLGRWIELYRRWLRKVRIDQGGIGYQIAQTMQRRHPGLVEGVTMSQLWQGKAAGKVYGRFESERITVPKDEQLAADLQQVEQVGTTRGGQPIVETARSDVGHADRFWSLALALDAMPEHQRRRTGRAPRGVRARV